MDPVTVLLVDDHAIVRDGLRERLTSAGGFEVVGEASSMLEGLRLATERRPDVAVVDVRMPGSGTGIDLIREIRSRELPTRCLIVTSFPDAEAYATAVLAGADGYVLKGEAPRRIVEAVATVARGEQLLDPGVVGQEAGEVSTLLDGFTDRERDIFELVALGRTNREIARELNLAEKTVRNYVSNILAKTGRRNRTELAAYLVRATQRHPT